MLLSLMVPLHAEELRDDESALIERYETVTFKLGSCDATEYPKLPKSYIEAARQVVIENDFSQAEIECLNEGFDQIIERINRFVNENVIITAEEFSSGLRGEADDRFYDFTTLRTDLKTLAYQAYHDAGYQIIDTDGLKPLLKKDESLKKPQQEEVDSNTNQTAQDEPTAQSDPLKLGVEVGVVLLLLLGLYGFYKQRMKK